MRGNVPCLKRLGFLRELQGLEGLGHQGPAKQIAEPSFHSQSLGKLELWILLEAHAPPLRDETPHPPNVTLGEYVSSVGMGGDDSRMNDSSATRTNNKIHIGA